MNQSNEPGSPWYRHFWPWFIVALLATTISASLATVVIAVTNPDPMVSEAYYAEGSAINERLASERRALALGLSAQLRIGADRRTLELTLVGDDTQHIVLTLRHPTRADRDQRIDLTRAADGRYRASLPSDGVGAWYANLEPAEPEPGAAQWRIARPVYLMAGEVESLEPIDRSASAVRTDGGAG